MPRPPVSEDGTKSVTFNIRMTAKMRFGLELMTRLYQRPMTEVISLAIEEAFGSEIEGLWDDKGPPEAGGKRPLLNVLWAERGSDRLANMALRCPELLSPAERKMWAYITKVPHLWSGAGRDETDLNREALALEWEAISEKFTLSSRSRVAA